MFVKFKRPYFSKDAVTYPPRVWLEVGDDMRKDLPSDAEVSETLPGGGTEIPDRGPKAIPGFGAQPEHEQELALVGANETHLLVEAAGSAPDAAVTDKNVEEGKVVKTVTTPAAGDKVAALTKDLTDKKAGDDKPAAVKK